MRLECTVLCNLGIVLEARGEVDDARVHYERSVAVAHELGDRRLEGQFRGYLGLLDARLGRFGESQACLAVGEALLLEASDQLRHKRWPRIHASKRLLSWGAPWHDCSCCSNRRASIDIGHAGAR